jgi:beta-lactam-binding protein with PASTA domain
MSLQEQFKRLMRMALLVFILAAAAFLSAITAMRFAIHGREVAMPNLVGKSAEEAQRTLAASRLGMKVADRVYSGLPANYVVRQSPPAGMRVKVTQNAHVILSLGPRAVTIPELEGKSLRAGRIELLRDGLQVGEISAAYLPEFSADAVVQQDPHPGSGVASPHVNLLVSQGAREPAYIMPYLVGLSRTEAERQLAAAGLHVAKITPSSAPQWPHDTVIGHTPAHGARVAASTDVELQVAE